MVVISPSLSLEARQFSKLRASSCDFLLSFSTASSMSILDTDSFWLPTIPIPPSLSMREPCLLDCIGSWGGPSSSSLQLLVLKRGLRLKATLCVIFIVMWRKGFTAFTFSCSRESWRW